MRKKQPHRGPCRSVCNPCQNHRYLAGRSPSRFEFGRTGATRRNRGTLKAVRERQQGVECAVSALQLKGLRSRGDSVRAFRCSSER